MINHNGSQCSTSACERRRLRVRLAGAAGAVLKVLRLTGLDVTPPLAPDVASILGEARTNGSRAQHR
jgi:hypothetical protein